jgi:hypothetical protein
LLGDQTARLGFLSDGRIGKEWYRQILLVIRIFQLSLSFLILLSGACNCDEAIITIAVPGACEQTFICPTGFEFRLGECRESRCGEDTDCCPGQKCNVAAGFCADQLLACSTDQQCAEVPGQKCIDFRGGQFCGYPNKGNILSSLETQSCDSDSECDDDRNCVGRRCLTSAPCNGGCETNEICDLDTNSCYTFMCDKTCAPGQIQVVEEPDTMAGPSCCFLSCACVTLPEVKPGQYGWYSAIATTSESVLVSAYDPDYGDLVVTQFSHEGEQQSITYVDGFSMSDPVVGDPNGLRAGRGASGPNVGEHTSMVVDAAEVVHIAYHDADKGALMYASRAGGIWSTSMVDDEGRAGLYTSIAIDADGNPRISYMMAEGLVGMDPSKQSALKVASASSNMPMSPSDWTTEVVDFAALPIPVCNGGCNPDQACVDLGMGPLCLATMVGCGSCASGEACIDNMGMKECVARTSIVKSDDLIEGTGLFSTLAFTSTGTPIIAYYDRLNRSLRMAVGTSTGGFYYYTLDGGSMLNPNDSGQHVSLAISPSDEIGVAYMDATVDDLIYLDLRSGNREIVDNGITAPDQRIVGADASLIFDATGQPAVAYQDPTNIDLLYARRTTTSTAWNIELLHGGPAAGMMTGMASGFYVSQTRRDNTAFICNVDVDFTAEGELLLELNLLSKSLQ